MTIFNLPSKIKTQQWINVYPVGVKIFVIFVEEQKNNPIEFKLGEKFPYFFTKFVFRPVFLRDGGQHCFTPHRF